ncbi:uncharacterized protein LOC123914838 [Trifolium pratense]|uniref:uncharacterized protein LOC123914838 n=1 Tax=Trifolium pratense TaxID=57577 RepID=UPI001E695064|nr:uncharacterized protein LOC123914838 [Trifolium pratense]
MFRLKLGFISLLSQNTTPLLLSTVKPLPISLRSPSHCDLAPISFSLQSRSGLAPFTISLRYGLDSLRSCENALRCIGDNDVQKLGRSVFPENLKATTISEITRLRNVAMTSITSRFGISSSAPLNILASILVVDERTIQMPVSLQQETDTLLQWSDTKVEKAGKFIYWCFLIVDATFIFC